MSFFEELKRRNVFRVGAAYVVIAWLLIQVADVLLPRLGAPEWFVNALMLVIVLGFPVALVIAWVFEVTPDGIVTQDAVDAGAKTTSGKKLNAVIISALLLAVIFMAVDNYVLDDSVPAPVTASTNTIAPNDEILETAGLDKSIAVLPFANLSNDPDQEFFSDGLAEELLNKLAQVGDLRVAARTSSFFYKGRNEDTREIGQALGVNYILEGSVRKGGNTLRITAQLIQADNGFHLWSETYDRELDDIFAIQDEIAEAVTMALSVTLRAGEFDRPGMTSNIAAYDAYLRGQQVLNEVGFEPAEAIPHLQRAVELDPEFALGWAYLGWVNYLNAINSPYDEFEDLMNLARTASARARELEIDLPETLSLEAQQDQANGNWIDADRHFRELIAEFGDTNSELNLAFANFLQEAGKASESIPYFQRARRLDPVNAQVSRGLGVSLSALGRFDEAVDEADRGLAIGDASAFRFLHALKTMSAYSANDFDQAIAYLNVNTPGQEEYDMALPLVEQLAIGNREVVVQELAALQQQNITPIQEAILQPVAAVAGDTEVAVSYMVGGSNQMGLWLPFSRSYFNDPSMKQLFRENGLVAYWQVSGWNDFCGPIEGSENDFECD